MRKYLSSMREKAIKEMSLNHFRKKGKHSVLKMDASKAFIFATFAVIVSLDFLSRKLLITSIEASYAVAAALTTYQHSANYF